MDTLQATTTTTTTRSRQHGSRWMQCSSLLSWRHKANFITIHYAYIILAGLSGLVVLYPHGNLSAIDAFFFGVSSSTESGLNTVDLKDIPLYQQVYTYLMAIITNVSFISIVVVVVRLHWFRKKLKTLAPMLLKPENHRDDRTLAHATAAEAAAEPNALAGVALRAAASEPPHSPPPPAKQASSSDDDGSDKEASGPARHISFAASVQPPPARPGTGALYIPGPKARDSGHPFVETDAAASESDVDDDRHESPPRPDASLALRRRRTWGAESMPLSKPSSLSTTLPVARVATTVGNVFILGKTPEQVARTPPSVQSAPRLAALPMLSQHVTVGRNSQFLNLTSADMERLGGIEYRALKTLLKIIVSYYIGLMLLGIISLLPWILHAPQKYRDHLDENAIDYSWWAIYSAQTMTNNLGFTLTPDSMISFRDATWPMLVMTLLAFAGNTCYPILLRLIIWTTHQLAPAGSSLKETLAFLLAHPRRCYTLLFPSRPTWILLGIVVCLNAADVLLIVALDLENPSVNDLALGPRILSSLFQAASARHTGTATYVLSEVNPAVQFSLLVMMYISVLPIAISIRASNTYEERSLGIYLPEEQELDESLGATSYILSHIRNQLSFDLWYIFLGTFCLCISESDKIMEPNQTAFQVFSILFEVMSAYGCVGLSLGHPSVMTSLCGKFTTFGKAVICLMMIRGRHRGLPYALDRAIMLPDEQLNERGGISRPQSLSRTAPESKTLPMKSHHTR